MLVTICYVVANYVVLYNWVSYFIVCIFSVLIIFILFRNNKILSNLIKKYAIANTYIFRVLFICSFAVVFGMVRMMCVENNRKNIRDLEDKVISVEGYIAKIGEKEKTYELTIKNNNIKVLSYIEKKSIGENIWDNLNIGDKIRFKTSLLKFKPSSNLGQFNEYKYYTEQLNYDYKCYIDTYDVVSSYKCGRIYYKISNELYKIRLKISNRINRLYSKTNNIAGVLNAMLLGEKLYLNENTKELYSMAGISHILAISGLHITLIGMGLYRILRNFRINMYMASVLSVGILVLYGIMSGMSVATYRAVFLMCFTLLCKFFFRIVDV